MCKFLKQKSDGKRRKASLLNVNVFALNLGLCAFVLSVVGAYAFLAVGNTSRELFIRVLEKELSNRLNTTSTLTVSLNARESGLFEPEALISLKLVKTGDVEYFKGISGEVAIR